MNVSKAATDWLNARIIRREGESEQQAFDRSFYKGDLSRDLIGAQVCKLMDEYAQGELQRGVARVEAEMVAKVAKPKVVPAKGDGTKAKAKPDAGDGTHADKLKKLAGDYAAANKVTMTKAYDAVTRTPEGKALREQDLRA